jgi:class I fructose-bisphosphate aldolase
MKMTDSVKDILKHYDSISPGVKTNLAKILMHGKLAGTGKMVILPVDQGFEHGPVRSFAKNPEAYDPEYHFQLAIDAGLNAYAAPIGFIEACADKFAGQIPTILKLNSSNSLMSTNIPDQAITASPRDAIRLGCVAIGMTIYPGSDKVFDMLEEVKELAAEAKSLGLAVVIWSYPRGGSLSKDGETAIDICAYAAHIAALMGAHIIKVKLPTAYVEQKEAAKLYESEGVKIAKLEDRIRHIKQACFNGKRMVIFSGGITKPENEVLEDVNAINIGGGNGLIIGRNSFQRKRFEALELLNNICNILSR